jgi:hypothetical protein
VVVVAAVAMGGACLTSEVTRVGPVRPSRPENCQVNVYPTTKPPYPYVELASVRAECYYGRNQCLEEIRRQACAAGGDAVHGFSEGLTPDQSSFITATVTARTAEPPEAPDCEPICSPGFTCAAGKCIPQCNPACAAGEVCNPKRVCEPAAAPVSATP